jgi:hypothetical protein
MGVWRILLKNLRASPYKEDLSIIITFSKIHLAGPYLPLRLALSELKSLLDVINIMKIIIRLSYRNKKLQCGHGQFLLINVIRFERQNRGSL